MDSPVREHIAALQQTLGSPIPKSWSANFEEEPYVTRPDLVVEDSFHAIAATRPSSEQDGPFVNLVTPGELGDSAAYLIPALQARLGDSIRLEAVGVCGCGGFVVRVWRIQS